MTSASSDVTTLVIIFLERVLKYSASVSSQPGSCQHSVEPEFLRLNRAYGKRITMERWGAYIMRMRDDVYCSKSLFLM